MLLRRPFPGLSVLLLLGACTSGEVIAVATPTAVTINAPSSTVSVGGAVTLTASASANGVALPGVTPVWASSDAAVASVNSSGVVTGVSRGTATISATVGTARGSTSLTVIGLRSITLAPTALTLTAGQSVTLTATVDADPGVTAPVSWSTSNATIATVSNTGAVTAVGAGSALITATALGRSVTANVTVIVPTVASVNLSPTTASLIVGQTQQFTTTPRDSAGNILTGRPTIWSTNNATVASISATGVLTALVPGAVTVQATVDGRIGTATVTITPSPVASLTLSASSVALLVGGTTVLTATARDQNGASLVGRTVTWRTSNSAVATVDGSGVITAVGTGSAVITVDCEGKSATATVTVSQTQVVSFDAPFVGAFASGDTISVLFLPKNAAGTIVTNESYSVSIDGSELQGGTTSCTSDGCLQRLTSTVMANAATTSSITRTVTIRPSAVPAGSTPNIRIPITLLGNVADSLTVNLGTSPIPSTLPLNTPYTFYPYIWYGGGNMHLRNAEFTMTAGTATFRRCTSHSVIFQSHCMTITPTSTGAISVQIRQRKADGTYWTRVWSGQVVP